MPKENKNSNIYKIYITLFSVVFLTVTILIAFGKRTEFSTYEKRPTKTFPVFSVNDFLSSKFFKNIDSYLIDSVPFRDFFLDNVNYILGIKGLKNIDDFSYDEEILVDENAILEIDEKILPATTSIIINEYPTYIEYEKPSIDMVKAGAIIVGDGNSIRAMFGPGAWDKSNKAFGDIINVYKAIFNNINVYTMIVPMSVAFYAPENHKTYQVNCINSLNNLSKCFDDSIKQIDVYHALLPHISEDIFLRTDHHWSQLGAYYAAKEFAKIANVDFAPLDKYDSHSIEKYYGSLYQTTGVTELKDIGETFTYYTPNDIEYTNEKCNFRINEEQVAVLRTDFKPKDFFDLDFANRQAAYLIYMGGDTNITHIHTKVTNGRNLIILKDSFGNAVVPNLFYSFENIWVVDYRYFVDNLIDFVKERDITDMLFINSISSCKENEGATRYINLLKER